MSISASSATVQAASRERENAFGAGIFKAFKMIEHRKREAKAVYEEEFKSYQRQADSLKINWKDAVFEKFTFDAVYPEEVKLKYLNGEIWFRYRRNHFVIEGIEAVEIKAGYRYNLLKVSGRLMMVNSHTQNGNGTI
ncbi:MAG: hypothetical protein ACR2KX_01365 [Chitinophagaceae bacterium]